MIDKFGLDFGLEFLQDKNQVQNLTARLLQVLLLNNIKIIK